MSLVPSLRRGATAALATLSLLALAGCGGSGGSDAAAGRHDGGRDANAGSQTDTRTGGTDGTGDAGSVLVAYFSATGTTRGVAERIADATGGTLFAIEPQQPYTDADLDYNAGDSRVARERDSGETVPLVSTDVPDWDSYTTVFLGYPIWWGDAAWPINGFVEANDFTGKTVVPFCTSGGSGIGSTGSDLASFAGTGDWKAGRGFNSGTSDADIADWIDGMNL